LEHDWTGNGIHDGDVQVIRIDLRENVNTGDE